MEQTNFLNPTFFFPDSVKSLRFSKQLRAAFVFQAPYLLRNEALLVRRGEIGTITDLLLDVRDGDNPQDVMLMVLEPPRHGQLIKPPRDSASSVYMFHLDDLAGGLLRYAHDGSDTQDDAILLQVNDGYHFQNILFHIKIAPKVLAVT